MIPVPKSNHTLAAELALGFGGNGLTTEQQIRNTEERLNGLRGTGIEALVCGDIAQRQQHGIAKYGTTVEGNPLPLRAWLQHAYEEALDCAIYLRRAMDEMDKSAS